MEKVHINYIDLSKFLSNQLASGSKSIISMYDENRIIKIYNDYTIDRSANFKILNEASRVITKTHLPQTVVYYNKFIIGCLMKYYKNYYHLNHLSNYQQDFIASSLNLLIEKVKELTNNDLYPVDIYYENVLFNNDGNVEIIDLDDDGLVYSKTNEHLNTVLTNLTGTIIEVLFPAFAMSGDYEILKRYQIEKTFIDCFYKSIFSYELLEEFLTYIKTTKKIKKQ